ncbi:RDD family protein [Bacillus sp. B190/17]|uniref:RDD family protein n=1 Tax=Bacillus lumedeiriae TaxID=3058829 RepID=A0ABW8I7A9_9BACI
MITQPAGFWRRLFANILDAIIIGVPLSILSYFIVGNWDGDVFTSVINALYALVLPVIWSGYTIGKRILGVRIVKVNGDKLGFGAMLMRTLVAGLVYVVTLGIGLIISAFMVGLREDKRAIHDFIAGTYVTREKP